MVYRHTRTSLKIRSTPTDGKQKAQIREWSPETENMEFHIPAIPYGNRNLMVENSQEHSSSNDLAPPLPTLDLPVSENFSENTEENSQLAGLLCTSGTTLENAPDAPNAPVQHKSARGNFGNQPRSIVTNFTCKDIIATWISGFPMEIVEL